MRPRDRQRRPGDRSLTRSAAAAGSDTTTQYQATTGGPVYEWRECPAHPWYGVSVIVLDGSEGVCIPPLDGTRRHVVELAA